MDATVSVLIPCYNAATTIGAAIHSVLNQNYEKFEILVVDDGSTDNSVEIIKNITNPKLKLLLHETNKGIAEARNTLLKNTTSTYIAWLDSDDIALPNRLEKQVAFMELHPEIDVAGSWVVLRNSAKIRKKLPCGAESVNKRLLLKNCLIQPSVISKNFYSKEGIFYNPNYNYLEDFELWSRLRLSKKIANMPFFLTSYYVPENEAEKRKLYQFYPKLSEVLNKNLATIGITANAEELAALTQFSSGQKPSNSRALLCLMDKIKSHKGMKKTVCKLAWEYFAIVKTADSFLYLLKSWLIKMN